MILARTLSRSSSESMRRCVPQMGGSRTALCYWSSFSVLLMGNTTRLGRVRLIRVKPGYVCVIFSCDFQLLCDFQNMFSDFRLCLNVIFRLILIY